MRFVKYIVIASVVAVLSYYGWNYIHRESSPIEDVVFDRDYKQINELFHQSDNWYWMICNAHRDTYSIEYMLRHKASCQYQPAISHNDLITKVYRENGKAIGFCAYYPHSPYVWQFLFLLVDQEHRGKGVAKKMLQYGVEDMVRRGAIKVVLYTRSDNLKAQNLYKKFGFKQFHGDEEGVWLSWYKKANK